jgi:hypothetical protein
MQEEIRRLREDAWLLSVTETFESGILAVWSCDLRRQLDLLAPFPGGNADSNGLETKKDVSVRPRIVEVSPKRRRWWSY